MKKELYIPLVLIGLSVAFIVVSFLLWLSRGNDSLLKKKLRIGALILTLSGVATGCWYSEEVTCYVPSVSCVFVVEDAVAQGTIELDMAVTNKLSGKIYQPEGEDFWYVITDQDDQEIQTGTVEALDGVFDEGMEEFELVVSSDVATGEYVLDFYTPELNRPAASFVLHIFND
jgi:hypothetical protein